MHIIIQRIYIFRALQHVLGFVGLGKLSSPILGHILLQVYDNILYIIGSDTDMEINVSIPIYKIYEVGQLTVPARKFFEICRTFSEMSNIILKYQDNKLLICSENSYFSLVTFSSLDFPIMSLWESKIEFFISQSILKNLIEFTYFSMGREDIRYYLNGMLFEFDMEKFSVVTTDGHRLSYCDISIFSEELKIKKSFSIIIPRKYVINMVRILNIKEKNNNNNKEVKFKIGKKNISMIIHDYVLTSNLINGVFPNYRSVFPTVPTVILDINSKKLKQAIRRSVILCSEKFHVVRFLLGTNQLKIVSQNSEHEKSEQILDVIYSGRNMEFGFNVYYILDVLNVIKSEKTRFFLVDENSSVQIMSYPMRMGTYIIMPIRL